MPSANPLVSVVMPVFNGERFVSAAVASILSQSYGDFDFHIVDDGSTDGTSEILREYAAQDDRIVLHPQPKNVGFPSALNLGCRASSGELIVRMDADDVSLPSRLDKQVGFLKSRPDIGLVCSSVQIINEHDEPGDVWPIPATPGMIAWSLLFTCIVVHPSVVVRRSVLQRLGYYPLGYTPTEDYALWMRAAKFTRLASIPEVLVYYRNVSTSLSRIALQRVEDVSTRIFLENYGSICLRTISERDVRLLRGFAQHRYPEATEDIARIAGLIRTLRTHLLTFEHLTVDDKRRLSRDAGVRLWILSGLALARGQTRLAAKLATAAECASPWSVFKFVGKAMRKSWGGRTFAPRR
jgi:glycosyltransferase involved in cell wall biosynthesis